MGMFDTFVGKCPHCGEEFNIQTKLDECLLGTFRIGSDFPPLKDAVLELKDGCSECGEIISVLICNHQIFSFNKIEDLYITHREHPWGGFKEHSEEVEEMMKSKDEITILPSDKNPRELSGWAMSEGYTQEEIAAKKYRIKKHPAAGTDVADQYRGSNGLFPRSEHTDYRGYLSLDVLEFLWGRPWNNMSFNYVMCLNPSSIRVVQRGVTLDCSSCRVTVYLEDDDRTIRKISQEVSCTLIGAQDGGHLIRQLEDIHTEPCFEDTVILNDKDIPILKEQK